MEKRRAKRVKKRLNVKFGINEADKVGFLEDISITGIKIKTNNIFRPGTKLIVQIIDNKNSTTGTTMYAEGVVTWAKKVPISFMRSITCGMGIAFLKINLELKDFLDELLIEEP